MIFHITNYSDVLRDYISLFERWGGGGRKREIEWLAVGAQGEGQVDSALSKEDKEGMGPLFLRSANEPKSRVHTNWQSDPHTASWLPFNTPQSIQISLEEFFDYF